MKKAKKNSINKWPYIFLSPYLLCYLAFGFFPIVFSFIISFTKWDGIQPMKFAGLDNYVRIFTTDPYFYRSILNTVTFMLAYIPIVVILGLLLAVALNSKLLPLRNGFRLVNFFPYLTTPVAIGLIFALLFEWTTGTVNRVLIELGIVDQGLNWMGDPKYARYVMILMLVWKLLGYHMMIYSAGLATISPDLYEAAEIDGAGFWQSFFHISLPQVQSVTLFLVVTDIIHGLQMIDEPMQLFAGWGAGMRQIGGPGRVALTAVWNMYDTAFGTKMEYGLASAIAYGIFLFILVFSLIAFRINKKFAASDD